MNRKQKAEFIKFYSPQVGGKWLDQPENKEIDVNNQLDYVYNTHHQAFLRDIARLQERINNERENIRNSESAAGSPTFDVGRNKLKKYLETLKDFENRAPDFIQKEIPKLGTLDTIVGTTGRGYLGAEKEAQ